MKLLWLDLETTGLDPNKHTILEVACRLADFERPFETSNDAGPYEAVAYFEDPRTRTPEPLDFENDKLLSPIVLDMHTKNGLWDACSRSTKTLLEIESELLEIIPEAQGDDRPILAGSTIGFDQSFLRAHMPRLAARLHYRLYDVTSVKLFCQSLGMPRFPKAEAHRAMPDVLESIAHAKACAEWLLGARAPRWDQERGTWT